MKIANGNRRLADVVMLNEVDGSWFVDGIEMPWYLREVPTIDTTQDHVTIVNLPLIVEGVVIFNREHGDRVIVDPVLGNVGDWARNQVLTGLRERISWLTA